MKIPGRQDLLPLVGLAVAIIVLFSTPLTRVISWARVAEEQSGLAIFPALVVLAASLPFYAFRRRHAEQVAQAVSEVRRDAATRATSAAGGSAGGTGAAPKSTSTEGAQALAQLPHMRQRTHTSPSSKPQERQTVGGKGGRSWRFLYAPFAGESFAQPLVLGAKFTKFQPQRLAVLTASAFGVLVQPVSRGSQPLYFLDCIYHVWTVITLSQSFY